MENPGLDVEAVVMSMPKKNWMTNSELLKDGLMVAKDIHMPKHPELADQNVPSLHVMKAMHPLKSRGYGQEQSGYVSAGT